MRALVEPRAGAGILVWVALLVIIVLSVVGIYQKQFASQITVSVTRSMAGELALAYGQSVIEEAMHQVRMQANDPISPIYRPLRRPVVAPKDGYLSLSGDLKAINLSEAPHIAERGPMRRFRYTEPVVEVLYQRQFENLPDERFGLIRYSTRVSGRLATSETIVREVQAFQEFRTVLITTPRPFDELPFYVGRASALTDLKAANEHRRTLLDLYRQSRDLLKGALDAAPAGPIKDNYQRMYTQTRDPVQVAASAREVLEEPEAHVTGIWYTGQSYALESMDLARRLQDAIPKAQRAIEAQASAFSQIGSGSGDTGVHDRMMATSAEALTMIQTELLRIWGFNFAFQFIPPSVPEYDAYENKAQQQLGYDHWRKLAFFVLKEENGGPPGRRVQAQFERLIKRAANPNSPSPPFNGVVLVDSESEPLTLKGNLSGKMIVIVTRGGLRLENVNPDGDMDDSLLAVCLGGTLETSGIVNACLVAAPYRVGNVSTNPTIRMQQDTVIKGGLFLPEGASISDWRGLLQYDDKYYGGQLQKNMGWPDHYYVGVSPRTVFRTVVRK